MQIAGRKVTVQVDSDYAANLPPNCPQTFTVEVVVGNDHLYPEDYARDMVTRHFEASSCAILDVTLGNFVLWEI